MECGWSKHPQPRLPIKSTASASLSAPLAGDHKQQQTQTSQLAPYSFLPRLRGAEKRKEELSELQEDALKAHSKRGWGGGGNQEGAEGKGKEEQQEEEGGESARPQKGRDFGNAAAPRFL